VVLYNTEKPTHGKYPLRRLKVNQAEYVQTGRLIRAKDNSNYQRLYSKPKDKDAGIRVDQLVTLKTKKTRKGYPEQLRRVSYFDKERDKRLVFASNLLQRYA